VNSYSALKTRALASFKGYTAQNYCIKNRISNLPV